MAETTIYFLTSYVKDFFKEYNIFIDGIAQNKSFHSEIGENIIFVNSIKILEEKNEGKTKNKIILENKERKKNRYYIKRNKKNKSRIFLFDYNLEADLKEIRFINWKFIKILAGEEEYLNENYTTNEKFSFFYAYLLENGEINDRKKPKNLYYDLVQTFLEEIDEGNSIPIDIGISVLIIYYEFVDLMKFCKIIKNIDKNSEVDIIKIKKYRDFYLDGINKCLNNLSKIQNNERNLILEIITIYFIKYQEKNIDILLNTYKQIFIDLFKAEKLYFLDENFIDEEIFAKIVTHILSEQNILKILNTSENYVSYIKKIIANFDKIYNSIKKLKSLEGIFQIGHDISQNDNIEEFVKYHQILMEKQEKKKRYFISALPVIKKYYTLYLEYNNLEGLGELLTMLLLESKKLPKFKKITNLKCEIIPKIRDILKQKIEDKEIIGKDIIKILLKLKEVFNDENIFDINYKMFIIKYFIIKCKENDKNIIEEYKNNEIYNLFIDKNIEKNILLNSLKDEEFEDLDKLISLLPDEMNSDEIDFISDLINKVIEKDEEYDEDTHYIKIFKRKDFLSFLGNIKLKEANYFKIFNLIIGHLKINNEII